MLLYGPGFEGLKIQKAAENRSFYPAVCPKRSDSRLRFFMKLLVKRAVTCAAIRRAEGNFGFDAFDAVERRRQVFFSDSRHIFKSFSFVSNLSFINAQNF